MPYHAGGRLRRTIVFKAGARLLYYLGCRVIDCWEPCKVSIHHLLRWECRKPCIRAAIVVSPIIIEVEEQLILQNRPPNSPPEVIETEKWDFHGCAETVVCCI